MIIGFFDSGIGGITVLHDAINMLPDEDYIYYADTLHVPYGTKSKEEVKKHVFEAVDFIVKQDVDAVVIACNTATSVAIKDLRARYKIPIIGMEPAVKPALTSNGNSGKRVLVTATALTLKEEKLKNLISRLDNDHIVDLLPLPGLVTFAEKFEFDEQIVLPYLQEQLSLYDLNDFESIVLGCTHFSLFKDMFQKLLPPSVEIIDGNTGTINNLKRTLKNSVSSVSNLKGSGTLTFYNSGIKVEDRSMLSTYSNLFQKLDSFPASYRM